MTTRVEVAIVGAGFAGIAMATALLREGRDSFLVLERAGSVGGTWRDNVYPGVACDVPSHLYGLAAWPNPGWSSRYAPGAEIAGYLRDVVERSGIGARLRLGSPVHDAAWREAEGRWRLRAGDEVVEADAVVLACGRLTEPVVPDVPGLAGFPGRLFHSARWDRGVDLAGARVAVVGTGASAVQLVPEVVRAGARVTVFQRTPAWIVPRGQRRYTQAEREALHADPTAVARLRDELLREGEERHASRSGAPAAAAAAAAAARAHLREQVPDPALRAALTPRYAFGCKRVLLSDDFYPAIASGAAVLEASALAAVEGASLVAESGARHEADVVVLATGFASTRQPYAERVFGERGRSLADHWRTGMTSFASTVVSGFPNLYVLNGPNASLGHNSAVLMIEEQAGYVLRSLALAERLGEPVRVDPAAEAAYAAEVDAVARSTPWLTGGCRNWYVDERSGRLALLWPGTVEAFARRLAAADGSEFLPARRAALPAGHGAAARF